MAAGPGKPGGPSTQPSPATLRALASGPLKPPAKVTRILGNPDPLLERTHVVIYDYLDALASLAFNTSVTIVGGAVGGGITQLTGNGTAGPGNGSQAFTNVSAPDGFLHQGRIITTVMTAPGTPLAGTAVQYVDSTSKNFASKDDAGNINHGVRTRSAVASNWIRAIADNGAVTISQPAFTDISGSLSLPQIAQISALSVLGNAAGSLSTPTAINTSSGTGFTLRENGGAIGWGVLATTAYGPNTVTYAKIQQTSSGPVVIGKAGAGAGNVQELSLGGVMSISGTALTAPIQYGLTFGGNLGTAAVSLPVFIGVGDGAWVTTPTNFGLPIPSASSKQDWCLQTLIDSTTASGGSGVYTVTVYKNGSSTGVTMSWNLGTIATFPTTGTTSFAIGDIVQLRLTCVPVGFITGGLITVYITGRFYA